MTAKTKTRRSNAERSAETRNKLLAATIEVLVERGWQKTSTVEICRRAKLSRGAILHHFPTKGALVAEAVEHLFKVRHAELRERFLGLGPGLDLDALLADLWTVYRGPTLHAWMELVVAARTDAEMRPVVAEVNARFSADVEHTFRELFGDRIPARAASRLIMAIFDGLALNQVLEDDETTADETIALLRALISPWLEETA